jgi:hypothetical protein
MKVENIKSNGISTYAPAYNIIGDTLKVAISLYKLRHTESEIFEKFPQDGWDYHAGIRFNDNETIAIRICSALTSEAYNSHFKKPLHIAEEHENLLLEGIIKSFVDSLSMSEIDIIILDAMRDCASSDHWYTFEKEW